MCVCVCVCVCVCLCACVRACACVVAQDLSRFRFIPIVSVILRQYKRIHITHALMFTDKRCPPPPYVDNSTLNHKQTHVGVKLTVTCSRGFVYPDDADHKTIACKQNMTWSPVLDHCYGMP